jgi:uncharacterized membrane protein (DUF4010 family)
MDNHLVRFAIAFLIGALIGIEREKANREDGARKSTGLRTFMLIAQAGAITAWLSVREAEPLYFVAGAVVCGALILAGYRSQLDGNPDGVGLTTEFAAFVTFLLGGLTMFQSPPLAVALGITTSAVLAYREVLHAAVDRMGWDDIYAGLKLLIVAFIVLPVVPREPVDPWGALNPYDMTWLVILIAGVSFLGYVIARWLGASRGTLITGLAGGLVSSTATTLSLSRRSRAKAPEGAHATLASGILISWAVMFARIVVTCLVVNVALAWQLALPMGVLALVALIGAFLNHRAGVRLPGDPGALRLRSPFSLSFAIKFAMLLAIVSLLVNRAQAVMDQRGVYAVAALAGLTDVDAITISMARGGEDMAIAVRAIIIAALANTLSKAALVRWSGNRALALRVLPWTLALVAGALVSIFALATRIGAHAAP